MESEPEKQATPPIVQRVKEVGLSQTLLEIERELIYINLAITDGNKTQAAKLLGWKRTKLISRMKEFHGMALLPPFRAKINSPEIQDEQNPQRVPEDCRNGEEVIPDALSGPCPDSGIRGEAEEVGSA